MNPFAARDTSGNGGSILMSTPNGDRGGPLSYAALVGLAIGAPEFQRR